MPCSVLFNFLEVLSERMRFSDSLTVNNSFTVTCEEYIESLPHVLACAVQGVAKRDSLLSSL